MTSGRPDVIQIVQPFVPTYRKPLFDAISAELGKNGYRLEVLHDSPRGRVAARGNADTGVWSVPIRQRRISVKSHNITYRHVHSRARCAAAVIAGLASTNLETYALALDPSVNLMLWGHGRNFTSKNNGVDQALEAWLARRASHIFTYTDEGKAHVVASGIDEDSITVVENTTDADLLRELQLAVSSSVEREIRSRYDLVDRRILLFVGAFDASKELGFLFEAADLIAKQLPDVALVVAGAGPEEKRVQEYVGSREYARAVGRLDANGLAQWSNLAELLVVPGRVGLVAVDSLALGLPIATTDYPYHAPEAAYLKAGVDSLWAAFDTVKYAEAVVDILSDRTALASMRESARMAGGRFSVGATASRFVQGILSGLGK
ncbi:glycosyltransferase [Gordonia alkanivorans]|uniref:glycosyltransferase n=1 Tax=Gordonia alkanivorans TaxID=84096 RepID=UPI0024B74F37|nr:glycosyltransferase [Gordonia alkanivorans]MDJ0029633.1 glycosyltransferase [Gordonia alkanivorans]